MFVIEKAIVTSVVGGHLCMVHLTVPVLSAVVGVRVPADRVLGAVNVVVRWGTIRGESWWIYTVLITGSTDGTVSTVSLGKPVATGKHKVEYLVVWAHEVFSLALVAVPILPAVEWVRPPPIPSLLAVENVATVCGGGSGGCGKAVGWVCAWSGSTFYNIWKLAPRVMLIKEFCIRTGLMGDTPRLAAVKLGAGLGIHHILHIIGATYGTIRQLVVTLALHLINDC